MIPTVTSGPAVQRQLLCEGLLQSGPALCLPHGMPRRVPVTRPAVHACPGHVAKYATVKGASSASVQHCSEHC